MQIDQNYGLAVFGIKNYIYSKSSKDLLDDLRRAFPNVFIQIINSEYVFGFEHICGVLKITLENMKRGLLFTERAEIDFLLRMICTDQIKIAIYLGNVKEHGSGVIVTVYQNHSNIPDKINDFLQSVKVNMDNDIINENTLKKNKIIKNLENLYGKSYGNFKTINENLLSFLIERAALIVKK